MDNRKILIMNLAKGRIGEDNSALLGAMMITKVQLAAMARVDVPEEDRPDFYLYVDEFQNFATESFANILSEARKYHLNLVLANQYVTQIDEKVRDAIFGNAGSIVSFRVGATDAEFLEKEFEPAFTANDIVNLPKYHIYLKLMIDGIAGDAFSAETLPPIKLEETLHNEEKIIRSSRERYANSKAEVEEKIRHWTGMLSESERAQIQEQILKPKTVVSDTPAPEKRKEKKKVPPLPSSKPVPAAESESLPVTETAPVAPPAPVGERTLYDTLCATCGEAIQVPFRPDGERPTFCKECLKDYQRAVAKERAILEEQSGVLKTQKEPSAKTSHGQSALQPKTYAPADQALSLGQMRHMAPKKFKPLRKKADLNLQEVQSLVKEIQAKQHHQGTEDTM
jgi:CxxC-x17-CxxC domain-containing protein